MVKNEKGYVILVRVEPYGVAEREFNEELSRLHEEYRDMRCSIRLGACFGTSYNQYVVKHDDLVDLRDIEGKINKMLLDIEARVDFPKGEMTPLICFAEPC